MADAAQAMPERLGRYEIIERLAAGGMGEVFVARFVGASGFVKPVALKRIHPELASDETLIHMLHDEANVVAAIKHPNIVGTIDVGEDNGNHFVVLDYVSGEPLTRVLRGLRRKRLAMPGWVVAWIGAEVASALHAAHEARSLQGEPLEIVHRDVSPANVLLSDNGHPMLVDFGVAKARQRLVTTIHGELKGKIPYIAPEVFHGAPVDRTVDVFGLGVVLYELLSGASPFLRETELETIAALQSAEIVPPSQLRQDLDPRLDPIVLRAMARDRAERYRTAAALERDLRAWARAVGARHDAASVAAWISKTFADRCSARQALLARVAQGIRSQSPAGRADPPSQGVSHPMTPFPASGTERSFPGLVPEMQPTGSPRRLTPLMASAAVVALGLAALLGWLGRGKGDVPAQAQAVPLIEAVPPTAPTPPTPTPAEPVEPTAASAAPVPSAPSAQPAPHAPPRAAAKPSDTAKSKGPIRRSYDP